MVWIWFLFVVVVVVVFVCYSFDGVLLLNLLYQKWSELVWCILIRRVMYLVHSIVMCVAQFAMISNTIHHHRVIMMNQADSLSLLECAQFYMVFAGNAEFPVSHGQASKSKCFWYNRMKLQWTNWYMSINDMNRMKCAIVWMMVYVEFSRKTNWIKYYASVHFRWNFYVVKVKAFCTQS